MAVGQTEGGFTASGCGAGLALDELRQRDRVGMETLIRLHVSGLSLLCEKKLVNEYRRFESGNLIAPPLDVISRLPDDCFLIWIVQAPIVRPPDLAEQRPLEDRLLEVAVSSPVAGRKSVLTIFRSSDFDFRMVTATTWTDEQNRLLVERESFLLNMTTTRFVPAYAVPNAAPKSQTVNNVLLYQTQDGHPLWQYLKCPEDVFLFQQAFTGYHVCRELANVRWSFNGSEKSEKSGNAKLQLWQVKRLSPKVVQTPEAEIVRRPSQPGESTVSLGMNPLSPTEKPLWSRTGPISPKSAPDFRSQFTHQSTATFLSSSSTATSRVTGSRDDGTVIVPPDPPVLIMYTMYDERYTVQQLERRLHQKLGFAPRLIESQCMTFSLIRKNVNVDARQNPAEEQFCRQMRNSSTFGDCRHETQTSRACTLGILHLFDYPDTQNIGLWTSCRRSSTFAWISPA